MNFTDGAFLKWFFPLVFIAHWVLGSGRVAALFGPEKIGVGRTHTLRKSILLIASYYFYAVWDWKLLSLIVFSTTLDYWIAYFLDYRIRPEKRRAFLTLSIVANLGLLGYFKYTNFFVDSFIDLAQRFGFEAAPRHFDIILPVGISFYTFQSMSYVIDVYRGHMRASKSWLDFYLFVAFFPQLVAGPIVRAVDFMPQLLQPPTLTRARFFDGLELFMIGLFKKLVVANEIAGLVDTVYGDMGHYSGIEILAAAIGFCFQIYCDFSGYSNMAIGCSRMLGYELCENFRLPYLATSVTDYWRRWHMSLSTWFRDYLYIPLGGNRGGALKTYRNLVTTFLLTGLWHGANWTFVMFGAWNGFMLIVERIGISLRSKTGGAPVSSIPGFFVVGFLWTTASTIVSFIFFRATTMTHAGEIFSSIVDGRASFGFFPWMRFGFAAAIMIVYHASAKARVRERLTAALSPRGIVFARAAAYSFYVSYMLAFAPLESRSFIYFQF